MELRHLRHFVAVAEELHFGRAARRLNIAQPPLSQSIRRFEFLLDVKLFDRSKRGVFLTEAGAVLLGEARRTLRQADLAKTLVRRAATREPDIRVSFIGPALYRLLPNLLIAYRKARPNVNVRLYERTSADQMKDLMRGEFDIAFVAPSPDLVEGESMIVETSPVAAAVPSSWPISERESVSIAELAELPFILPPQHNAPLSVAQSMSIFEAAGLAPRVVQEAAQTNTALSLVGVGVGCSLVMATASLSNYRNVTFLPIQGDRSTRPWQLSMVWRPEYLNDLAGAFVSVTKDHVKENFEFEFKSKVTT